MRNRERKRETTTREGEREKWRERKRLTAGWQQRAYTEEEEPPLCRLI
jgi:hypothetical protein